MRTWRTLSRGILVFTNVLFLLLGAVLVALGGYMISIPDLHEFSDGGISSAIIMCGSLIVLIAMLGCCGAQWESKVFLFPYAILVVVSVLAQLALAGFLFHVHNALVTVAAHNFDLSVLSSSDREILKWINHRFGEAYHDCGLTVDIDLSVNNRALTATCSNEDYTWFAEFIETNCRIGTAQLKPGSEFLACAGSNFSVTSSLTRHTMLCACESRMIQWVNDQSLLIAVFVGAVAFFEITLVFLSCYIMFSRRGRSHGYQEIRMPLKQHPYNPHPRNYQAYASTTFSNGNNTNGNAAAAQQPLFAMQAQPSYSSMAMRQAPSQPTPELNGTSRPIHGPSV